MLLAALQHVEKSYGDQTVLADATLELHAASRMALIGRNGSGKSTILRLILSKEKPDKGTIFVRADSTIAMLEQDPVFEQNTTITAMAERAFADITRLEEQLRVLETEGLDKPEVYEKWEQVHAVFERRGGYERRSRRDSVLYALGFRGREDDLVAHLSGGEKTRLGLARLLMAQPDILLLDEPTNHLDMQMRAWLESYLSRYPGGMLLVSHDREFLDRACGQTAEISLAKLRTFEGNPSAYRTAREEQLRIEAATRHNQQKENERLKASVAQMRKWANRNSKLFKRVKAMEKRLERYQATMIGDADPIERTMYFNFDCDESGEIVLQAKHLSKAFDRPLFKDVDLTLRQGERVALIGPNGAGKSSFLRVLMGEQPSDDPKATLTFGSRVRAGYYDQELRGVDPELTLTQEVLRLVSSESDAHNLLGAFMFPYDAQFKRIKDLSGGERARLALLKLCRGRYNLLILDEPTNHLDVEMIEALEQALSFFTGTLIVVSHDRRFIAETAEIIWDLKDGALTMYEGDWDYYTYKTQKETEKLQASKGKAKEKPQEKTTKGPSKWQLERDIEGLEHTINALEQKLAAVNQTLTAPEGLTPEELIALSQEHAELDKALSDKLEAWGEAQELLEAKS